MKFSWQKFCESQHIYFVTAGPNTAAGNISVKCPFCGSGDPSEHMGLSVDTGRPAWGCLRNAAHRGNRPGYLIAKLLNINLKDAIALAIDQDGTPVDEFEATVARLKTGPEPAQIRPGLRSGGQVAIPLASPMRPLKPGFYAARFLTYLSSRGFPGKDAERAAELFGLYYALTGDCAWRLIFPIRTPAGGVVGWTARSVLGAQLRYKAMDDMGKDVLYVPRYPTANTVAFVIVEGPLDAIKLQFYGGDTICAVALMGTSWTEGQLLALTKLVRQYRLRIANLWDRDAAVKSFQFAQVLETHLGGAVYSYLPTLPWNDPGEMPGLAIRKLVNLMVAPYKGIAQAR